MVALVLRLIFVLIVEPDPDFSGGDTNWYMANGRQLVAHGKTLGPLQTPPLYLVFVGVIQVAIPGEAFPGYTYTDAEMQAIRLMQAVLGTAVCLWVSLLARRVFSDRVGWLAGGIMAVSPTLVLEAGNLTTEGLFLFFMFAGLAFYTYATASVLHPPTPRAMVAAGVAFGLATLTRAVFLTFPLLAVVHLFLIWRAHWRRLALALLLSYTAVVSTWTVYNLVVWQRLIIGGQGFMGSMYKGVEGQADPEAIDTQIGVNPDASHAERETALREAVADSITRDPAGWITHRVKELATAYLQPHNTVRHGGKSIKSAAADWLRHDRTPGGLIDLTHIKAFWSKLALYVFHFAGLILGAGGMLLVWRRWRTLLLLYSVIAYFTGIHLVILALPRYLLPVYLVFWIFAAALIVHWWQDRRSNVPAPIR